MFDMDEADKTQPGLRWLLPVGRAKIAYCHLKT